MSLIKLKANIMIRVGAIATMIQMNDSNPLNIVRNPLDYPIEIVEEAKIELDKLIDKELSSLKMDIRERISKNSFYDELIGYSVSELNEFMRSKKLVEMSKIIKNLNYTQLRILKCINDNKEVYIKKNGNKIAGLDRGTIREQTNIARTTINDNVVKMIKMGILEKEKYNNHKRGTPKVLYCFTELVRNDTAKILNFNY